MFTSKVIHTGSTTSSNLTLLQAFSRHAIYAGFDWSFSKPAETELPGVKSFVGDLLRCTVLVLVSLCLVTMSLKLTSIASSARLAFDLGCGGASAVKRFLLSLSFSTDSSAYITLVFMRSCLVTTSQWDSVPAEMRSKGFFSSWSWDFAEMRDLHLVGLCNSDKMPSKHSATLPIPKDKYNIGR